MKFKTDLNNKTDINIQKKLSEMQREINNWSERDLTPFRRLQIIKCYVKNAIFQEKERTVLFLI